MSEPINSGFIIKAIISIMQTQGDSKENLEDIHVDSIIWSEPDSISQAD